MDAHITDAASPRLLHRSAHGEAAGDGAETGAAVHHRPRWSFADDAGSGVSAQPSRLQPCDISAQELDPVRIDAPGVGSDQHVSSGFRVSQADADALHRLDRELAQCLCGNRDASRRLSAPGLTLEDSWGADGVLMDAILFKRCSICTSRTEARLRWNLSLQRLAGYDKLRVHSIGTPFATNENHPPQSCRTEQSGIGSALDSWRKGNTTCRTISVPIRLHGAVSLLV